MAIAVSKKTKKKRKKLTLVLPLPHATRHGRAHEKQVDHAADEHGGDADQRSAVGVGEQAAVGGVAQGAEADAAGARRERQRQQRGQRRLHGEVDGENVGLQLRELRPREHAERDHPADEGLEECASQERTIAARGRARKQGVSACNFLIF